RALSALMNGDAQTALREYEGLAARDPDRFHNHWDMASGYWHALYFARARQLAGQEDAAEQTLAEAERRLARFEQETGYPGIAAYYRAAIASLRNDRVRARDFLEQAHEHGWRRHAQVRTSPLFVPIRDDAEIAMLLDAVRRLLERARTSVSAAGAPLGFVASSLRGTGGGQVTRPPCRPGQSGERLCYIARMLACNRLRGLFALALPFLLLAAAAASAEPLRFSVSEGRVHNEFFRDGPVAAHLVLTSGAE